MRSSRLGVISFLPRNCSRSPFGIQKGGEVDRWASKKGEGVKTPGRDFDYARILSARLPHGNVSCVSLWPGLSLWSTVPTYMPCASSVSKKAGFKPVGEEGDEGLLDLRVLSLA